MAYSGVFLGKELIDWAIHEAETTYKGQISVIVADRFANMHPGDAASSPRALTYFVPKTQVGMGAAEAFIIDGIGYDYWALPWERLEEITEPYSLVFGNEATGLPDDFASFCQSVIIPHSNGIDSLNLPVAASIAMYEFTKARWNKTE